MVSGCRTFKSIKSTLFRKFVKTFMTNTIVSNRYRTLSSLAVLRNMCEFTDRDVSYKRSEKMFLCFLSWTTAHCVWFNFKYTYDERNRAQNSLFYSNLFIFIFFSNAKIVKPTTFDKSRADTQIHTYICRHERITYTTYKYAHNTILVPRSQATRAT